MIIRAKYSTGVNNPFVMWHRKTQFYGSKESESENKPASGLQNFLKKPTIFLSAVSGLEFTNFLWNIWIFFEQFFNFLKFSFVLLKL